ncbi:hypothetical protein J7M28_00940 [bacterium]|nr:hypothetical protein [bacterium]
MNPHSNEGPQRTVNISAFLMPETEITQKLSQADGCSQCYSITAVELVIEANRELARCETEGRSVVREQLVVLTG